MLLSQMPMRATRRAPESAGSRMATRIAMMAMTMSSSMSVKPGAGGGRHARGDGQVWPADMGRHLCRGFQDGPRRTQGQTRRGWPRNGAVRADDQERRRTDGADD